MTETVKSAGEANAPEPVAMTRPRAKPIADRPSRIYAVELPSFEGPLDLLLHLVRRHELEILDIPIAFITEKYLEYLDAMRALDIEILGDYLVMAATLAYLKSRELVPQQANEEDAADDDDEEGEDPREALIRRLIEYERFRAAGRELNSMPVIGRDVFPRGGNIDLPPLDPGMAPVTLFRLAEAYSRVLARAKINKCHEVVLDRVTVRQRMEQLSLMLDERESVDFESLFLEQEWSSVEELRQMLVVTLMSVLELVKLGIMGVQQANDTETIRLQRRASYAQAMRLLTSYSEEASFGDIEAPVAPSTDEKMSEETDLKGESAIDSRTQEAEPEVLAAEVEDARETAEETIEADIATGEGSREVQVLADAEAVESGAREIQVDGGQEGVAAEAAQSDTVDVGEVAAAEDETFDAEEIAEVAEVAWEVAAVAEESDAPRDEEEKCALTGTGLEPEEAVEGRAADTREARESAESGAVFRAEETRAADEAVTTQGGEESEEIPSELDTADVEAWSAPDDAPVEEPLKTVFIDAAEVSGESDE